MEYQKIDAEMVDRILTRFLYQEVTKTGFKKVVLGLSGGIDSATVAYLCARTFQSENITALIMPYHTSNPDNIKDAQLIVAETGITHEVHDISAMVDAFFSADPGANMIRRGNRMARERMCFLYDYSSRHNALVIGTSNKTELLLGYGTIFGDLASAINPIGDLYKSQIWQLAEFYQIPDHIIKKPPSADLWSGQTDENEIGYSYSEIDRLLHCMVDMRYPETMLVDLGFSSEMINSILSRMQKSQFKRRPPVIAKLSNRTINQDFRYCRDWGI